MNRIRGLLLAIALSLSAGRSAAHHSFAMFDFTKSVTFRATIKEFQWTNPHVIVTFTADAEDGGEAETWWAELTSPGNLTRVGWSKRALKAGDRVDLTIHPLRDGSRGGAFMKAALVDTGQVWTSDLRAQEKPELGVATADADLQGAGELSTPDRPKGGCSASPSLSRRGSALAELAIALLAALLGWWRGRETALR
jgi:hypothetical protein